MGEASQAIVLPAEIVLVPILTLPIPISTRYRGVYPSSPPIASVSCLGRGMVEYLAQDRPYIPIRQYQRCLPLPALARSFPVFLETGFSSTPLY
jgi:hypothetical protein